MPFAHGCDFGHAAGHCMRVALCAAVGRARRRAQIGSDRYASIVIDAQRQRALRRQPGRAALPASLTKMMTLYMLFEALRDRRVSLNQYVPVSARAASMPPTKLGLVPGSLITVEQAILGLVTKSANDAAAALGEMLGGDEDRFAQMMTLRARALGMTRTTFRNASGLPDWNQVTTARDMAILARHLIQDFPATITISARPPSCSRPRRAEPSALLQTYPGADGLKTGYIEASGYNVVTSALRGDTRLIGVVLGAASGGERDQHMTVLLDEGFARMGVAPLLARREPGLHMPGLIASAHAAPPPSIAAPPGPRMRLVRPAPQRSDRWEPRSFARRAPEPRFEPEFVRVGRPAPLRVRESVPARPQATTRTARQNQYGRYPG